MISFFWEQACAPEHVGMGGDPKMLVFGGMEKHVVQSNLWRSP